MRVRTSWNERKALHMLKKWIVEGNWKGTAHFRKHNPSLYEYLYRTMGLDTAFRKLGLNYSKFKKSKGKHQLKRKDEEVITELHTLIESGKWKGIRNLQVNHSPLYRDLSRIGFREAFDKLGLDYKAYRHAIWTQEEILEEFEKIIESGEWKGSLHLKEHNRKLYNAITRHIGFQAAFHKLGLDYNDYKNQ